MIDKRMMYAMGQRVAKTLDGSRPGYRGDDAARSSEGTSAGRSSPGAGAGYGDGPSSSDRDTNTGENNSPQATGNSPPLQRAIPMDVREQYAVGNPTTLGAPIAPAFMSPQLETNRYNNFLGAQNLRGATYEPMNIPPGLPGGMILNTLGNVMGGLGFEKNKNFFAENVAGKYGFGYDMNAYKDYMKKRTAGEVGAYGNENMGQNAMDERANMLKDGSGGIMDVYTDNTTDDTTTENELLLRFLGKDSTLNPAAAGVANTDELRAMILERAKNLYT